MNCLDVGLPEDLVEKGGMSQEAIVWLMINWTFSAPATRSDDTAEYAPTQILAEAFRQDGADGLLTDAEIVLTLPCLI